MKVNDELVNKLARLSALEFDAAEQETIKGDLQKMIAFVEKLQELDTTGVAPRLHMLDHTNRWREDMVKGSVQREEALRNAPDHTEEFFRVPKVIRK